VNTLGDILWRRNGGEVIVIDPNDGPIFLKGMEIAMELGALLKKFRRHIA
jgi:hypothetical protein